MTHKEAVEFLTEAKKNGIRPGLSRVRELLRRLNNPQDGLKFIHVAGTNGKGSTCRFMASALTKCGIKVGSFNTPQLKDYEECFTFRLRNMSEADFTLLMEQIVSVSEEMRADEIGAPTEFECMVGLAMLFFAKKNAEIVILECGMGGLSDATNVIDAPLLSVLTRISYDHMQYLGETLTEIATQKAGIIKSGSKVVTVAQNCEVMSVISEKTAQTNTELTIADESTLKKKLSPKESCFKTPDGTKVTIHMLGSYQIENAYLAFTALSLLTDLGYTLPLKKILAGFEKASWHGRFTLLDARRNLYIDGAHNEGAAERLKESIESYFTNKKIVYIMGMLKDKEYDKVTDLLTGYAQAVVVITPSSPRGLDKMELAGSIMKAAVRNYKESGGQPSFGHYCPQISSADSLEEALEMADLLKGKKGIILAFGSLSFLGELTDIIEKGTNQDGKSK